MLALRDEVYVSPALIKFSPPPVRKIIGDLNEIPDSYRIAIFRVLQEAMNNVAKHSETKKCEHLP
jgi:signal transduction histidine kinase